MSTIRKFFTFSFVLCLLVIEQNQQANAGCNVNDSKYLFYQLGDKVYSTMLDLENISGKTLELGDSFSIKFINARDVFLLKDKKGVDEGTIYACKKCLKSPKFITWKRNPSDKVIEACETKAEET